ncbi:hypothetical protein [Chryseobacterium sp.]|uniref:hypothetical protein n=1 Tax=Chryseobacterium sp. TaxID=1871047 RepID=UPI00333E9C9D
MKITKILSLFTFIIFCISCSNDDNIFHLKTIRLNEYELHKSLPEQHLYLKVFDNENTSSMTETESFPSYLPLPVTVKADPSPQMNLYARPYRIELWGDVSGLIGSCTVNMDDYKIVFPIDMEVKSENLEVSLLGSWE